MRSEIKKILEMSQAGTITAEQAATLIEEITKQDRPGAAANPRGERPEEDPTEDAWQRRRREWIERRGGFGECGPRFGRGHRHGFARMHAHFHAHHHGHHGRFHQQAGGRDNAIVMSRVENPVGRDFVFERNSVNMASLTHLHFDGSEFAGNRIDASKMKDIRLLRAALLDSQVSAGSIHDWEIENARVTGLRVMGSKSAGVVINDESTLERVDFSGSSIKDVRLSGKTTWRRVAFEGCAVEDLQAGAGSLEDSEFQGAHLCDVTLENSELKGFVLRAAQLNDVAVTGTKFNDVVVSGGEGWSFRRRGFGDCRFENCDLTKVLFSDCHFSDVVFKNITVRDVKLQKLSLSDKVIDGNEAFLALAGKK